MNQTNTVKIVSEDSKMMLICDADTNLGVLHDFLLNIKGIMVDKINKSHAEEVAATEEVRAKDAEKIKEEEKVDVEVVKE